MPSSISVSVVERYREHYPDLDSSLNKDVVAAGGAHHLLARPDLPAISNWWGLLLILFFSVRLGWLPAGGSFDSRLEYERHTGFPLIDGLIEGDPKAGDLFYTKRPADAPGFARPIRVNSQAGSAVAVGNIWQR